LSAGIPDGRVIIAILLFAISVVYLPDVGHGFVKDDFGWVAKSRLQSWSDVRAAFGAPSGFFRPAVSLSFGLNRSLCGTRPLCYGITNFSLLVGCAIGVGLLARALSLPVWGAVLASAMWMFNWHGINMAVLWISGRTALLLVLFATCGAAAFVKGRWLTAAFLIFAAMLSKEEAVLLPPILIGWSLIDARLRNAQVLSRTTLGFSAASAVLGSVYYMLRAQSGAFTPSTAPPFYRFSFTFPRFFANAPEYLDRSATFAAAVVVLFLIVSRPRTMAVGRSSRSVLWFGAIWWIGALAITVFLPARSSLYACLPAVGAALIAATVIVECWSSVTPVRQRNAVVAGLAVPFLLWPIYHARNRNSVREAELSARTLHELQRVAAAHGPGFTVVLADDRSSRPSLDNSFGTGLQEAVDLMVTPRINVWTDPPPADAALTGLKPPTHVDLTLALENGQFTPR
jgi:hypothetical protein